MARRDAGEGDDRTSRLSKGERPSAECPMAMLSGGEADALNLGEGLDSEGCVVLEGSMTGLGEMVGMRRPSVVV